MSEDQNAASDGAATEEAQAETTEQVTEEQTTEDAVSTNEDGSTVLTQGDDEGAPEEYAAFDAPEGVEISDELVGQAAPVFKELGLSQGKAQKLVDLFSGMRQAEAQQQQESFESQSQQWIQDAKSDKEIGGGAFDEKVGLAVKALDRFGTPALKEALEVTGLGNHPEFIRAFARVGATITEDQPGGGSPPTSETSVEDRWYSGTTS